MPGARVHVAVALLVSVLVVATEPQRIHNIPEAQAESHLTSFRGPRQSHLDTDSDPALHALRPEGWKPPPTPPPPKVVAKNTTAPPCATPAVLAPARVTTLPKFLPVWVLVGVMCLCIVLMTLIYFCVPWFDDSDDDVDFDLLGAMEERVEDPQPQMGRTRTGPRRTLSLDSEDSPDALHESVKEGHKTPWEQYFALAFFLLLLICNAAFTRIVCQHKIPKDCQENTSTVDFVKTIHELIIYGFVLAIFTGIGHEARFMYIFRFNVRYPHGWVFMLIFFGASPVYGILSDHPFLNSFSLTTGSSFDAMNGILIVLLVGGLVLLVLWHLWYAHANSGGLREGFWAYALSRLVIYLIFSGYYWAATDMSTVVFHLHHYTVGFLFAIMAEFNHPLSLVLLAAGTGVMVQGFAAYGADPITHSSDFKGLF